VHPSAAPSVIWVPDESEAIMEHHSTGGEQSQLAIRLANALERSGFYGPIDELAVLEALTLSKAALVSVPAQLNLIDKFTQSIKTEGSRLTATAVAAALASEQLDLVTDAAHISEQAYTELLSSTQNRRTR
jgi:hypothetical protein